MANIKPKGIKTFNQLRRGITPMIPGQPEMIPWQWFDTQTYVSGTTTQLDFFSTVQSDKVLGNMEAAGQIPSPMFFDLYHLGVFMNVPPAELGGAALLSGAAGAINDVHTLSIGSIELNIAQKTYWKGKIFMCPAGAGAAARLAIAGTYTADRSQALDYATNGDPNLKNRNDFFGMITIPHNQNFFIRCNWTSALTLNNGNTGLIITMDGYLYRRVL